METQSPAPQVIIATEELICLPRDVAEEFAKLDKRNPVELRITIARLTVAARKREGKPRSLAAQAAAEQRAERNARGWRTVVDKMVEKARP